jgi:hypothetical protein
MADFWLNLRSRLLEEWQRYTVVNGSTWALESYSLSASDYFKMQFQLVVQLFHVMIHRLSHWRVIPDHLLLDNAPNIGPLVSRWELDKLRNCWNRSFRTSKILTLSYLQFSNLIISQRDMSGLKLGALSNNRWSIVGGRCRWYCYYPMNHLSSVQYLSQIHTKPYSEIQQCLSSTHGYQTFIWSYERSLTTFEGFWTSTFLLTRSKCKQSGGDTHPPTSPKLRTYRW